MISTIIITKNEEMMLPDCLKSLDWVDEIIVVDTGNTDKTNQVAREYKARITTHKGKPNFSSWRNKGLKEAKGDWILYVDADERITTKLKEEIKEIIRTPQYNGYAIPRKNFIFGKEFKHCGLYPDYVKRLFRRSTFQKWSGDLHEEPNYESNGKIVNGGNGNIGHVKNAMIHIKHETLSEMVEKTNQWSGVEAKLMYDAHHPKMNIRRFLSAAAREFWLRMIKQMAFLDGGEGIIYALYQVYSRFISYAKLWELQIRKAER